ncbi:enoyl-CoA hydratase/isomerase family protein [Georgenia sp. H159]|uniref:enoyl-CoA hydratase/isomerase family protein n=1 Tax=Georgenia sp. H159 TaxID=3076115 RepID=UPI002D772ED7|nr:enoyl-CoA hydratase-related protein [Georgenia sp. H159]
MTDGTLMAERTGDVLAVTLNRPDSLNAITMEMLDELDAVLDAALTDGTRVVTLTGAGRAFCAGADLSAFGTEPGATLPFLERLQAVLVRITELPLPVVAAVNGTAMGGGLELILASDFAIAAESAKVGDGHTNVGVIPGGGGATVLHHRVPPAIAKYVVFTGGRLTAAQWQTYGLFAEVVPGDELAERTGQVAARLAAKSPLALRSIKALMARTREVTNPATALGMELAANVEYSTSFDMAEGVRAFNEKRTPRFRGE